MSTHLFKLFNSSSLQQISKLSSYKLLLDCYISLTFIIIDFFQNLTHTSIVTIVLCSCSPSEDTPFICLHVMTKCFTHSSFSLMLVTIRMTRYVLAVPCRIKSSYCKMFSCLHPGGINSNALAPDLDQ